MRWKSIALSLSEIYHKLHIVLFIVNIDMKTLFSDNGKISNMKFVDFQLSSVCSPTRDLPYFLCGSLLPETMEQSFDELLNCYHGYLIEFLQRLNFDITPCSKEKFDEQLKNDANIEFNHCLMALKFYTVEISSDSDLSDMKTSIMMSNTGKSEFIKRARQLVSTYLKKDWFY